MLAQRTGRGMIQKKEFPSRIALLLKAALIVAAGAWAHAPALHGEWLRDWDDATEVTGNTLLREPGALRRIWLNPGTPDYLPLKTTAQWIEWHLWQDRAVAYHAVNIALHLLGALLLWRLLGRLGVRMAWLGGLFFAVHPLAVESVAWLSEFKNVLSLPFLLLAATAFIDHETSRSRTAYVLSVLCFLASMLCKSSGVMLPVVLLAHAWWRRGRVSRDDLVSSLPFLAISLALGLVSLHFQRHLMAINREFPGPEGPVARLAVAGTAALFYGFKCLWPFGLSPVYPRWNLAHPALWRVAGPWLVIAVSAAWLCRGKAPWRRGTLFSLGCFGLFLVPVLGFVPMTYFRITWVADHFAYLPLACVAGLAAAAAGVILRPGVSSRPGNALAGIAVAAVIAILALSSRGYSRVFRDEETLWSRTVSENPGAWIAHANLSDIRLAQGRVPEAETEIRAALLLEPRVAASHNNLGNILSRTGRLEEAVAEYEAALRLNSRLPEVYFNLGDALFNLHRYSEAARRYGEGLRLSPDYAPGRAHLSLALSRAAR